MEHEAQSIVLAFAAVDEERRRRSAHAPLERAVRWVKRLQHQRLSLTHARLLSDPSWGQGGRFFLDQLYGDRDDRGRDAQFLRVVPTMLRVLPQEGVAALCRLARLHALSERLDGRMGDHLLVGQRQDAAKAYVEAWRRASSRAEREEQVAAMREIGASLGAVVHLPMLSGALRLMKGPARLAGLSELHAFLAEGLRCFRAIDHVDRFVERIGADELALIDALFTPEGPCPAVIAEATASIGEVPW